MKKVYPTIHKRKYVNVVNMFERYSTDDLTGRSGDAHYLTPLLLDIDTMLSRRGHQHSRSAAQHQEHQGASTGRP